MSAKLLPVTECIEKGNSLHAKLDLKGLLERDQTAISRELFLNNLIAVQIKCHYGMLIDKYNLSVSIKLDRLNVLDNLIYSVKFSSNTLGFGGKDKVILIDDISWNLVYEGPIEYKIDLSLFFDVLSKTSNLNASLHDDTSLVDFELCGTDGSVHFHKAILAGFSPVLKTMLSGAWKEANTGSCQVRATKETLQQLKDYIYLQKLPESDDVEALGELASYYMNDDLKKHCGVKLLRKVDAANFAFFMEFALKYKIQNLYLGIVASILQEQISFDDIVGGSVDFFISAEPEKN